MNKKIIFTSGGTGGHIIPTIHLMEHFFKKGYNVLLVTDSKGKIYIKDYPEFKYYILTTSTPTNKNFIKKIFSIFFIIYALIKSIIILKKEKPDLIFGLGGYVSFPICLASKFFNIPMCLYENNMILGRANKYLSNISKKIFTAAKITANYPKKYLNKTYQVGPILNKKIINSTVSKNLNEKNFTILVLGGSQGAEIFAQIIPESIKMLKDKGYNIEIFQQCLPKQKNELIDFYNKNYIKNNIFNFDKNISELMLSSNIAITRCGASTTAEMVYTLTPFVGIPLPNSIDNHQYLNGKYYEEKGCCWLIEQNNLNNKTLYNLLIECLENKNNLKKIIDNMKKNKSNNAYNNIENEIKELI